MSKESRRIKEQMLINQAISSIKRQINELESSRKKYIETAVTARSEGIASQYALAKSAIRIVTMQKVAVEQMLISLQLSAQIKDVSEMTKSFADGMKLLSGSITDTVGGLDYEKVYGKLNKAMISTQLKQAEYNAFAEATSGSFAALADGPDDIDAMIDNSINGYSEATIDDEIAALERKIKSMDGNK